jgi:hypothetical protein
MFERASRDEGNLRDGVRMFRLAFFAQRRDGAAPRSRNTEEAQYTISTIRRFIQGTSPNGSQPTTHSLYGKLSRDQARSQCLL